MKNNDEYVEKKLSFPFLAGYSAIVQFVLLLPIIVFSIIRLLDSTYLLLIIFLSLLSILFNSTGIMIFALRVKHLRNFLIDSYMNYGWVTGVIFGIIASLEKVDRIEKIIVVIIGFFWGMISGSISSIWIKHDFKK
jgi:hypothetical protein